MSGPIRNPTTILPNQIPSTTVPFLSPDGKLSQVWWLFFYNIAKQVLGSQGSTAAAQAAQLVADLDADADQADALYDKTRIAALEKTADDTVYPTIMSVNQALKMAYETFPDPIALYGANTTTAPSAGGAGGLPATPKGYVTISINGKSQQMAYY